MLRGAVLTRSPRSGLWLQEQVVELGHERPFIRSGIVAKRLCTLDQDFVRVRPEDVHGLVDEFGEGHRPRFVVAAQQISLHPGRRDLENADSGAPERIALRQHIRMQRRLRRRVHCGDGQRNVPKHGRVVDDRG